MLCSNRNSVFIGSPGQAAALAGGDNPFAAFFCWGVLSLTLADLGGEGECVLHAVPDMAGNFDTVSAWPRHERNLMAPYFAANRCDGVTEGQACFWIPGGGSRGEVS